MSNYSEFIHPDYDEHEKKAVGEYLDSGGWLTEYEKTREFERMIAKYVGARYCSVVPSCTTALSIAVMVLHATGDVIVPDYTMIASANAVVLAGGRPVLVDVECPGQYKIERATFCLALRSLKIVANKVTRAIILVSMNGRYPNRIEEILEYCRDHHINVIEDAAQSLGSRYKGKHVGTYGDIGCFSFSMFKTITTGQGGCLVTDNAEVYEKIKLLKNFGRTTDNSDLHSTIGYNYHFTDVQAVVGIEQMKKLSHRVERKREILKLYQEQLKNVYLPVTKEETSLWLFDALSTDRDSLREYLTRCGIGTRGAYPGIHTQAPYIFQKGAYPGSCFAAKHMFYLPSGSYLTDEDVQHVCKVVNEYG